MGYDSLRQCVDDLRQANHLVQIDSPVDPHLEAAEIQRRVFTAGGPALLFSNVVGCKFPMVCNLFGTLERARYLFRDGLPAVQQLVQAKADPSSALRKPWKSLKLPRHALTMLAKSVRNGPVLANQTTLTQLPQLQSWPADGGPFITLPAVYSEDPLRPGLHGSNLGMYRVQLAGNDYTIDKQVGLHYQIHRSIGVHHQAAIATGKPFRVNIFIGGPPALPLAAVMPLPEGMSELMFAGALNRRRARMIRQGTPKSPEPAIYADADFCITGTVHPDKLLPEGPFGDHLGYYSLEHPFPVLEVDHVYHRDDPIWPFTVVGRPPQEDTVFGQLIHEITGPLIPTVLPGVQAIHAVDAAGVHPLLMAIGSERYMPMNPAAEPGNPAPQELLTQANAILGQGQLSLAKFLMIVNRDDDHQLDLHHESAFLKHLLARADWRRDLHFQTQTTIDTLDYSGGGLNSGSKVVMAAVGPARFQLAQELPTSLTLPEGFTDPCIALPGVLAVRGPRCPAPSFDTQVAASAFAKHRDTVSAPLHQFVRVLRTDQAIRAFRWIVVVDDSQFVSQSLPNFLWAIFTRTNPASDLYGIDAQTIDKHWGCNGPLVFDARVKPHHAPPLEEDPAITSRVDALAANGGPLQGLF